MRNPNLKSDKLHLSEAEQTIEKALRPQQLDDFAGQPHILTNLEVFIKAASCMAPPD